MQHQAVAAFSRLEASRLDAPVFDAPRRDTSRLVAASAAPLAGLAGTALARRFRHWRGGSGKRHLFSVFPLGAPCPGEEAPRFADAVVLAVGRDAAGEPCILAMDETGPLPELFYDSARFRAALAAGAHEVHVHLLTDSAAGRAAVLRDLEAA
ncbi:hypothetical protein [Lichenibacterium ramalinae]|uniref:Uncharacterized protein n=1 Tax=Lichenibacterium ramalinae TaxID=2316527 RepID=A0A4Q2RGM7_9HYPH|nr:hypothetical protein [Lichenibacterium ramalinae]RYB06671.1 hypothetical protein D3272_04900 [Lichenibacterium ramalinae]